MKRSAITFMSVALAALLCACGTGEHSCPPADTDIVLPDDESPHDNVMEWWYYTGHLSTASGRRYGFELSFFQTFANDQVGYVGHFAISDPQAGEHTYSQKIEAPPGIFPSFDIDIDSWNIRRDGESHRLQAEMENFAIDLELVPLKPEAFHGDKGLIEMGGGMQSYYYSMTRMQASGTLKIDGVDEVVTGIAWHDHQWGDFDVFASNGWDWFSLQLDDRTELMIFLLHFKDQGTALTGGTFVDGDGCASTFDSFEAQALSEWTSPHTGAVYPMDWTLSIPSVGLDLKLSATVDDQEMDCRATTLNTYWEGEVEISGTRHGKDIGGLGYIELAGYGPWGP